MSARGAGKIGMAGTASQSPVNAVDLLKADPIERDADIASPSAVAACGGTD